MGSSSSQLSSNINVDKLPSIPHTLIKLIDLFNDDDTDFKQISELIQKDPALTGKIFTLSNSAAFAHYNINGNFKDFQQMLVVLGLDTIKTLVTTAAVQQFFSQFNTDTKAYMGDFWLASVNAAFFAKAIAKLVGYSNIDESYLAGLLHQIGKLILFTQYYQEYAQILEESKTADELKNSELKLFGISANELGANLVNSWQMKSFLADAILYQDSNAEQLHDTPLLIRIVNLSYKFSRLYSYQDHSIDYDNEKLKFIQQAYQLFGLTQGVIEDTISSIGSDIEQVANTLGVERGSRQSRITNSEKYSLFLAQRVKNIALSASIKNTDKSKHEPQENREQPDKQIISNLMLNLHIVFGLSHCLYFSYKAERQKLICSAENINTLVNLSELNIQVEPARSLLARAYNKKAITSSFESKTADEQTIIDRYISSILKTDGILCIPLFSADSFFGVMVVGVSQQDYSGLLEQRLLLGDFTRTAAKKLQQAKQQQQDLNKVDEQQNIHIRKLIHEANNPLSIINNYLQVLSLKLQDSDKQAVAQIETLQQEVERVASILLRMKEPAQQESANSAENLQPTNINALIEELVSVFQNSLFQANQIVTDFRLDNSIPQIQCDSNGLKQILLNLIKNAAEAMPDGGVIELETHDLITKNQQQFVEIKIIDSGSGISEEVINNLFKPVISSKGEGHSGLGLSISKNIVDKMNGFIHCDKAQSGGTKFVILLPRITA